MKAIFHVITALLIGSLAVSFIHYPGEHPQAGAKYVCFTIVSDPPGAIALKSHPGQKIDTYIGITPVGLQCFTTEKILEGSSTIRVRKGGYEDWTMEIDLRNYYDSLSGAQNKPVVIQAVLKPVGSK